jgi:hypothetical protein
MFKKIFGGPQQPQQPTGGVEKEEVEVEVGPEAVSKLLAEELAKKAVSDLGKKEGLIKLKEIRDTKTYAAIDFLSQFPAWRERFGDLLQFDSVISPETLNLVKGWMEDPNHVYDEEKTEWTSTLVEEAVEKRERKEEKDMRDRLNFEKKFGYKIKVWEDKGYTANMDELLEAYKKNPNLELVTTPGMKIAWGRPTDVTYEIPK